MPDAPPPDALSPLIDEALDRLVRLHSGHASEDDRRAFHAWRAQSDAHRLAYQAAETLWREIGEVRPAEMRANLRPRAAASRSATGGRIAKPAWAVAACLCLATGWFAFGPGMEWALTATADHHTAVGEQRVVLLADGSRVHLNTDTALNVAFTDQDRTIRMLKGEAAFTVAPDANRPFIVQSGTVRTRALGTAFLVRLSREAVTVTVTEHAVHLSAAAASPAQLAVREGEQVSYTRERGLGEVRAIDRTREAAWQRGKLIVESQPLTDVVTELNRYRPGRIMILNPALRPLTVTGVFDLADPDAALRMIEQALPIHDTTFTPYLVLLH